MKRILVIENEVALREVILEFLEAEGFETIGVEDGQEGVQIAREAQPDLILCNILMPKIDGFEVLAMLQQKESTATIPFIFLSAKAGEADLQRGLELGANSYLTKPFKFTELLAAITSQLGSSE